MKEQNSGQYMRDNLPESVAFVCASVLKTISFISKKSSKEIKSLEELKLEVTTEALRLGIVEPVDIRYSLEDDARSRRNSETGILELYLGGFFARKAGVRHEVYHLLKHVDKPLSSLGQFYLEEFQALAYETLRLRL
jgi:hypothetical protein